MKDEVLILGAGVSGLSTGVLLALNKYKPIIWAKDLPPNTTSNAAAAVWYPFHADPPDKVARWARTTLDFFLGNVVNDENSGVYKNTVTEIFSEQEPDPFWKDSVKTFRRIKNLPFSYKDGYAVDGVVMVTDIYMQYLLDKFRELGGIIEKKYAADLEECLKNYSFVINCTGLGAKEFVKDSKMHPCRGQVIRVPNNGFPYTVFEEKGPNGLAYIIPRKDDIILGGTIGEENDWNLEVNPQDTDSILKRCSAIYPEFKNIKPLGYKVGLRPARKDGIRLETELINGGLVVHNYGHGGSGFTLSWGCALEVMNILKSFGI